MNILNILLEISIYSSVIYAAVMLIKKILGKKMSPLLHYAIWILLAARLLMPFTIDSGFYLIQMPAQEQTQIQAAQTALAENTDTAAQKNAGTPAANTAAQMGGAAAGTQETAQAKPAAVPVYTLSVSSLLVVLWLAGIAVCLVYLLATYIVLQRHIAQNAQPATARLQALLSECRREMGIRANIEILSLYGLETPALLMPRTILMPMGSLVSMSDAQIKFAIQHELMHYKRKDHLVSVLMSALQAIYWFNPFVWLAFRQVRLDMEIACDNQVVRTMSSREKSGYAELILCMFTQKSCQRMLWMAQGNTKKVAEKRIRGIYMDEKSRPGVKLAAGLAAGLLLVACFTTACQPKEAQASPTPSSTGVFAQSAQPSASAAAGVVAASGSISPTTGMSSAAGYRPVQVQIDNEVTGRPQYGIQAADIVYEAMIEGADTRLSAIYNDTLPAKVGPVRSARVYFQYIQNEWDSIFMHEGGPYVAGWPQSYIYSAENGGNMKVRIDATRRQDDNILWHANIEISYANVQAAEDKYNYQRTVRTPAFQFGVNADYSGYPDAAVVDVPFVAEHYHPQYRYDKGSGMYLRYWDGQPFVDAATNKTVEVRNVIVQYVKDTLLSSGEGGRMLVGVIGSGKAEFFMGGKRMTGTWQKTGANAGTVYKLDNGSTLQLTPGNTWIELQPDTNNVKVTNGK